MQWKKFTIETTTQAEEFVSGVLISCGISSIEVEDKVPISEEDKKKMFIDILPDQKEDDGIAYVSFYLEPEEDEKTLIEEIKTSLEEGREFLDIGTCTITASKTEDKDWINNWKEFFKPFRVDNTIVIKPTWEELTDSKPEDMVIEIDPGTAFGTGAHETTKLCILNLKKYLKSGDKVLDLGYGSGILSIVSRKLGSEYVMGTDIDPIAVEVSAENAHVNHIKAAYSLEAPGASAKIDKELEEAAGEGCAFYACNVIEDEKARNIIGSGYNIVVANILADVIIPLSKYVKEFMKEDGYFISSGIIDMKADEVKTALTENGYDIVEETRMGDWVSYVAKIK